MLNNRIQMMKAAGNPGQQQQQPKQGASSQPDADAKSALQQQEQASETSEAEWLAELADVRSQDTKFEQLQLQALAYAKKHPGFVKELEAANRVMAGGTTTSSKQQPVQGKTQPSSFSLQLPNAQQLSQRLGSMLKAPQSGAATEDWTNAKMVQLAHGTLDVVDPATVEPVVLDWVREDRHQQRRRAREQHAQKPGQQSEVEADEWSDDDSTYQALHQAMLNWECARQVGKQPLPRSAPRGWLTTSRKHHRSVASRTSHNKATAAIPSAWLEFSMMQSDVSGAVSKADSRFAMWKGAVHERLPLGKWSLPWVR